MFNFFKKNQLENGEIVRLKIVGMHCTSCALNIDGALEDAEGVIEASTSYAKGETSVKFDPTKITPAEMQKIVRDTGYETTLRD